MELAIFKKEAIQPENPKWEKAIERQFPLYLRENDLRSQFERDYTRIIYSNAYRRLKHKTQVFFSPANDHICTRSEHVSHVDSISYTIAHYLGLNTTLTKAIATAHDLGHSPFGHAGEKVLNEISNKENGESFWHEKNGLYLVDQMELLEDEQERKQNLNLTYAVRDGIISHCGEIDENAVYPRQKAIDLASYQKPNEYPPYTWEACVVKLADKIAYVGRDIKDALCLGLIDSQDLENLYEKIDYPKSKKMNNTVIINRLIQDLCMHSHPEKGLVLSQESLELMNHIKQFNYDHIYLSKRLAPCTKYFDMVLNQIYQTLMETYDRKNTLAQLEKLSKVYPNLTKEFTSWIAQYWNLENTRSPYFQNQVVFDIENRKDYSKAILFYISGMTDNYAIKTYNEIIRF